MKRVLMCFNTVLLLFCTASFNSQTLSSGTGLSKPKLVVGIMVDQLRNDYIYRYWERFGNGGFKRLVNEGYYFKNAHYNYIPTYTGPGHCSVYTGTTPRTHGIIGNNWVMKGSSKTTYCTEDNAVEAVGSSGKNGKMSPKNQLSSTIGDELKMSTNQNAKVFSIALKDRSSILPAGHAANGAFWFDENSGNFISSTWYMAKLPDWVTDFNTKKSAKSYLEQGWETLYPVSTYTKSLPDNNRYEAAVEKQTPVFPYNYKEALSKNKWGVIKYIPAGNSITKDLAITCILSERLGKGNETDLLCISFSSTDYVGHMYGPRAIETEDVYLRLDKDLEELLNTLDKELGKKNYTVFLTSDHGGADVPNHLSDNKIPAGYLREEQITREVNTFLQTHYADSLLMERVINEQLFLNEERIREKKLSRTEIEERLAAFLITLPGIAEAYTSTLLKNEAYSGNDFRTLLQNGYNHKRSGHVAFIYQPGWMDYSEKGTSHGSAYNYDTHVPVIFYGHGIKTGMSFDYISITQIAPSVCELLEINQPNSTTSPPLNAFFKAP